MNTSIPTINHMALDSHGEEHEHENHTVGEELIVGYEQPHQGARGSDNGIIGQAQYTHNQAEHCSKNSAEHVHARKMFRTHHVHHVGTEHPEHQHVKQEMPEIHMDEHVSHIAPGFVRNRGEIGAKISDIVAKIARSNTGNVQLQA